ncbi:MAG: hypothetical protein ACSHW0_18525 [Thalassotalea sp.]
MKFLTLLLTLIFTSQAFAHTDHALGEGIVHTVYHVMFWTIFAAVAVKAYRWFKSKKAKAQASK